MIEFNLDIPRMGYAFLTRRKEKGDFLGSRIEKAQLKAGIPKEHACFTHIATCGGGPHLVDPVFPKVKINNILKHYKGRYVRIMKYHPADFGTKRYKVLFWATSNCNMPYDWWGVLKFKIKVLWHLAKGFFCSENYLYALQKEYSHAFKKMPPHKCMPGHIAASEEMRIVWEGYIPK